MAMPVVARTIRRTPVDDSERTSCTTPSEHGNSIGNHYFLPIKFGIDQRLDPLLRENIDFYKKKIHDLYNNREKRDVFNY